MVHESEGREREKKREKKRVRLNTSLRWSLKSDITSYTSSHNRSTCETRKTHIKKQSNAPTENCFQLHKVESDKDERKVRALKSGIDVSLWIFCSWHYDILINKSKMNPKCLLFFDLNTIHETIQYWIETLMALMALTARRRAEILRYVSIERYIHNNIFHSIPLLFSVIPSSVGLDVSFLFHFTI